MAIGMDAQGGSIIWDLQKVSNINVHSFGISTLFCEF